MSELRIDTTLNRVFVIGDFCDWDLHKMMEVKRKGRARYLVCKIPAKCEYKVLASSDWLSQDKSCGNNRTKEEKVEIIKVIF